MIVIFVLFILFIWVLGVASLVLILTKNKNTAENLPIKRTGNSYFKVIGDKGLYGEYLTVKELDKIPGNHKTIVNAYIPNGKGGTTEIDVLFIHETGIYVIESKNYSGWIFGHESDKNWTQTFPNGHKEYFYNPIKQNEGHMKALKNLLTFVPNRYFTSFIVFSERCELKNITVNTPDIFVLKRYDLVKVMKKQISKSNKLLTTEEIETIYSIIKPYTEVNEEIKQLHIKNIERNKNGEEPLRVEHKDKIENKGEFKKQHKSKPSTTKKKKKIEKLILNAVVFLILLGGLNAFGNSYQNSLESKREKQDIIEEVQTNVQQPQQEVEVKKVETNPLAISNQEINDKIKESPNRRITEKEAFQLIDNQLAKPFYQGFEMHPLSSSSKFENKTDKRFSYFKSNGPNVPSDKLSVLISYDDIGVMEIQFQ
ncbi:nuclease-related domain-containing protein [Bacillus sp. M6-12]|uniref:nuclease-related domain-containing protein n=1 Tax=Bacillus sp. M6-12 TaxID=2054166 RepID=UPI0015E07B64|nr:nuclease-related domain-containing protein [Bacillus sp. M6-12]